MLKCREWRQAAAFAYCFVPQRNRGSHSFYFMFQLRKLRMSLYGNTQRMASFELSLRIYFVLIESQFGGVFRHE